MAFRFISRRTLIPAPESGDRWLGRAYLCDLGTHWVMLYRQAIQHSSDATSLIHVRFSDDEGVTWTDDDTYLDDVACTGAPFEPHVGETNLADSILIPAPNGDVLAHVQGRGNLGPYQYRSTDGGKTWVDEGAIISVDHWAGEDYLIVGSTIYLPTRLVGDPESHPHYAELWTSDDSGATWAKLSELDPGEDINEWTIAYTGGTNMVATVKNENDTEDGHRYQSDDMGVTWGAQEALDAPITVFHRPRVRKFDNTYFLFGRDVQYTKTHSVILASVDSLAWGQRFLPDMYHADCAYGAILQRSNSDLYMLNYAGAFSISSIVEYVFRYQ